MFEDVRHMLSGVALLHLIRDSHAANNNCVHVRHMDLGPDIPQLSFAVFKRSRLHLADIPKAKICLSSHLNLNLISSAGPAPALGSLQSDIPVIPRSSLFHTVHLAFPYFPFFSSIITHQIISYTLRCLSHSFIFSGIIVLCSLSVLSYHA